MKNFVVIAEQDRGKTFFVKNEILKRFSLRHSRILFQHLTMFNKKQITLISTDSKKPMPMNIQKIGFITTAL
ncbi:MAG: hypothetical protein EBR30_21055 [Cytophagia bacterium]|nr:hypothetical protein [Cytophagia bacterium]